MKTKRNFFQYLKNNSMIFGAWVIALLLFVTSINDEVYAMTVFSVVMFITSLVGCIVDWKKNG